MLYQDALDLRLPSAQYRERSYRPPFGETINQTYRRLLEQRLFIQNIFKELKLKKTQSQRLKSQNSIWDTTKLLERFAKPEYHSQQAKIDLLRFDAIHHAKEMALVEPITRFSYWHTGTTNETFGDGYFEDLGLMLNTFAQDLAAKGLNASRASIEAISFERAKQLLTRSALAGSKSGILITSFPDDKEAGYHGVDSKHNWDKPETHHSFFYLLQVGETNRDATGNIASFEIKTTQYRAWPNTRQALQLHEQLGQPITFAEKNTSVANLLFANLIELNQEQLAQVVQGLPESPRPTQESQGLYPQDLIENELEHLFKLVLYANSQEHSINHTHIPEVTTEVFWHMQEEYFANFYLEVSLPVFEEITQLQKTLESSAPNQQKQILKEIQLKIDYLDKAFFYYSKVLLGWIKLHNTNPNYTSGFTEKSKIAKLMDFQQKLLLKILGQEQNQQFPSVVELKEALSIDHRLATRQAVSAEEKKKLLSIWGFFSFVGRFSSLLQCGTLAPFTMPLSVMNKTATAGVSISEFSGSLATISIPEKQQFLTMLQQEEYVELDLTKNKPNSAKKIYTVPKSYLEGNGCIVNEAGEVLGPCIDPATNERIPLDDPRDTLAFAMTLAEFTQYIQTLQQHIEQTTLSTIDEIFESNDFSAQEKRTVQVAIKKLRQKLIKRSLGLQEFVSGNVTNQEFYSNNEWLRELVITLSFSPNPVQTLVQEVEKKLQEKDSTFAELTTQIEAE